MLNLQLIKNTKQTIKMGFKKLINGGALLNTFENKPTVKNSKKILSLFAAFMLLGTNLLMAQSTDTATATADSSAQKANMWLGGGYYTLLLLLLCVVVSIIGKILKIYGL